jgi:hypothetical protein
MHCATVPKPWHGDMLVHHTLKDLEEQHDISLVTELLLNCVSLYAILAMLLNWRSWPRRRKVDCSVV